MKQKLGVLFVGALGSVATTVMSGALAIKKKLVPVRGLITESDFVKGVHYTPLSDIAFGGWDIRNRNLYEAAQQNATIPENILCCLWEEMQSIPVYQGIQVNVDDITKQVYGAFTTNIQESLYQAIQRIMEEIRCFKDEHNVDFTVVINVSSTEPMISRELYEWDLPFFESRIQENDFRIPPSISYAYAAIQSGCGFVNFTPSICMEVPALQELAIEKNALIAGKDGKTGQTLYKTVLAPMFKARQLKVNGWYSTNILGNHDGEILRNDKHARSKLESKSSGLKQILGYEDFDHVVRIDYYSPRGDHKEAWDNIDFEGWMGSPMSMKVNWIGSDSILAAPILLDMARLMDYAHRRGEKGIMSHLNMFFKSPYAPFGSQTEVDHDFFAQWVQFKEYLDQIVGREGES